MGPSDIRHTKNAIIMAASARVLPNICSEIRRIGIANLNDLNILSTFELTASLIVGNRLGIL